MIRTPKQDLEQELRNPEYAKLYGASDAKAEIAITLAKARHVAKKTQKELANAMGLSQPYIARLEGGDANPTIGTIGSLLALLGYRLVTKVAPLLPLAIAPITESTVPTDVSIKGPPAIWSNADQDHTYTPPRRTGDSGWLLPAIGEGVQDKVLVGGSA